MQSQTHGARLLADAAAHITDISTAEPYCGELPERAWRVAHSLDRGNLPLAVEYATALLAYATGWCDAAHVSPFRAALLVEVAALSRALRQLASESEVA